MAIIRGQGDKKFSKFRTDVDVPAIARPQTIAAGISLAGAEDIDSNNPANLYVHILGALPQQMILFLFAERFHQAHYTEFPEHQHSVSITTGNSNQTLSHDHSTTVDFGAHNHGDHNLANITGWLKGAGASIPTSSGMPNTTHNHALETDGSAAGFGSHRHSLGVGLGDGGQKIDIDNGTLQYRTTFPSTGSFIMLTHQTDTRLTPVRLLGSFGSGGASVNMTAHNHNAIGNTGLLGILPGLGTIRTSGVAKSFVNGMTIAVDGVDKTALLLAQTAFAAFGDGTSGHGLVTTGAQLDMTPFILTPGQHKITFAQVGVNNGGKIRYNFYTVS